MDRYLTSVPAMAAARVVFGRAVVSDRDSSDLIVVKPVDMLPLTRRKSSTCGAEPLNRLTGVGFLAFGYQAVVNSWDELVICVGP